jgi:hypothetical protein
MKLVVPLAVLALIAILTTRENPIMIQLKQRYYSFIETLPNEYSKIKKPSVLTGTYYTGDIGSNVNKGGEIYICVQDSVNDAFHVLLHELSHSMVKEYSHSQHYWDTFKNLKHLAENGGFYSTIGTKNYCGKVISDL